MKPVEILDQLGLIHGTYSSTYLGKPIKSESLFSKEDIKWGVTHEFTPTYPEQMEFDWETTYKIPVWEDVVMVTENGTKVGLSKCIHLGGYCGPQRYELYHVERGLILYYDKNLKHKSGNHMGKDSGLDIVRLADKEEFTFCPHCRKEINKND